MKTRCVLLLAACLVVLLPALPQNPAEQAVSPAQVVQQYCDFDLTTGRISSAHFAKLPPLVTWKEEPGWDSVTVVRGFTVLSSKQTQQDAVVTVKWEVLGHAEGDNATKDRKPETVSYKLKLVNGLWKIDSPALPPHVSLPTLRAFVIAQVKNESQRQALLLRDLDALAEPAKKTGN